MHRKLTLALASVLVAAILLVVPTTARAGEGGAIVFDGEGGQLLDGNGDWFSPAQFHVVLTPSKKGNVKLVLHATGVPNGTGRAVHWDYGNTGELCFLIIPELELHLKTDRWRETVSADGSAVLVAHFNSK